LVSLTRIVKVGCMASFWETGMYPEKNGKTPFVSGMGTQGFAKVLWTTEWFLGLKMNWTISPGVALMVLGLNVRLLPSELETWTGHTLTDPEGWGDDEVPEP